MKGCTHCTARKCAVSILPRQICFHPSIHMFIHHRAPQMSTFRVAMSAQRKKSRPLPSNIAIGWVKLPLHIGILIDLHTHTHSPTDAKTCICICMVNLSPIMQLTNWRCGYTASRQPERKQRTRTAPSLPRYPFYVGSLDLPRGGGCDSAIFLSMPPSKSLVTYNIWRQRERELGEGNSTSFVVPR